CTRREARSIHYGLDGRYTALVGWRFSKPPAFCSSDRASQKTSAVYRRGTSRIASIKKNLRPQACSFGAQAWRFSEGMWRRRPDLNRGWRFCRPLPYLLATAPLKMTRGPRRPAHRAKKLERETGFEPPTSTLARSHSTTELFPLRTLTVPSQPHRAQDLGGLLGRRRVDVEPGSPLEAGDARQPRHDLDVPVVRLRFFRRRRRVQHQVPRRRLDPAVEPLHHPP